MAEAERKKQDEKEREIIYKECVGALCILKVWETEGINERRLQENKTWLMSERQCFLLVFRPLLYKRCELYI